MEEIAKDPRFAHVPRDPKFRRIPKKERKVKIDKRFHSMFKDKSFKVTYTIDKRGRPLKKTSSEDLEKYYEVSSDSESSKEDPDDLKKLQQNESTKINPEVASKLKDLSVDYARGEGVILSDSSSEESEEDSDDEGIEHMWGELDKEAETTEEVSSRLAVCNMDWDRMRAVDLMVLFNSFLPPGGLIHSITIYPSEFGIERMKEEEIKGPIELNQEAEEEHEDRDNDDDDEDEGSEFRREKLRQYQLNRLKYYYAVMVCDSPATANKIYSECDGHEYESTATRMDLRFIPDDMEFEQEPKEVCEKLPDLRKYQPRQFTTTALQQVKVECTWDETKLDRQEITKKINSGKIEDIEESDIKAYLASGTSDESDAEDGDKASGDNDDDKDPLMKYKSLLKSIEDQEEEKKKKEGELEFTWGLGTKEKAEKLVQEKIKKSEKLTPFEEFLEKRKEKKKAKREGKKVVKGGEDEDVSESEESVPSDVDMNDPYFAEEFENPEFKKSKAKKKEDSDDESQRKAELELLMLDKDEEEKQHFDMKKIEETELLTKSKRKRLLKKKKDQAEAPEDNFEVNVEDPRFNALFTSHHFNIDPADPHYKKTRGTEALVKEKLKRRANNDVQEITPKIQKNKESGKMSADLAALVKSVKRNTQKNGIGRMKKNKT